MDVLRALLSGLVAACGVNVGQAQTNDLVISSPANGTVVAPGDFVQVTVENPSGRPLTSVSVVGQQPVGFIAIPASGSASLFQLTPLIPDNTRLGPRTLAAFGATTDLDTISSAPVTIDVERADVPTGLSVDPAGISFRFVGETIPLRVTAQFADATEADATQSSRVQYASTDTSVATVDALGMVTATGFGTTGNAEIRVTYGTQTARAIVSVPNATTGDLDADGDVDQDDVNILQTALDTPAASGDARDLNRDGIIDAADLAILQSFCTRPGCATR
jgi:hypothetical protein